MIGTTRLALALACLSSVAVAAPTKTQKKKTARAAKVTKAAKPSKAKASKAAAQPVDSQASTERHITRPSDGDQSPAYHYNMMGKPDCEAELVRRKISFVHEEARGVVAPVRLTGPLHGVTFHTDGSEKQRATSPYEIGDCRLILAMDDFAEILAAHDIVEVRHYSMYRPPDKSWPDDKPGLRHNGAVALDAARFTARDGRVLDVDKHFNGAIGAKTCGEGAGPVPVTPEATELRAIVCEAVARRLFNVVLTPNYNQPHHNHFHLEVTAGWKSFLVD